MRAPAALIELIQRSYGNAEAERHRAYVPSREHLELAAAAGTEILKRTSVAPGACTYMSAMWAAMLRDNLKVPAFCVAGDLCILDRMAFGSTDPEVAMQLGSSNDAWEGHCWLALGDYLGDISVFRTAYAAPEGSNLRAVVTEQFGPNRGLYLGRSHDALQEGLDYRPKHVEPPTRRFTALSKVRARRVGCRRSRGGPPNKAMNLTKPERFCRTTRVRFIKSGFVGNGRC